MPKHKYINPSPSLSKWLDAVKRMIASGKITVADVARGIDKPDNYNQVYGWLVERKWEPRGDIAVRFIHYALSIDPKLIRLFGKHFRVSGGKRRVASSA